MPTPEWGGDTWVIGLDSDGGDDFSQWIESCNTEEGDPDLTGFKAKLFSLGHCNESGERYSYTSEEVRVLGTRENAPLTRCCEVIRQLSGLDLGELEKNYESGQSDNSGCD